MVVARAGYDNNPHPYDLGFHRVPSGFVLHSVYNNDGLEVSARLAARSLWSERCVFLRAEAAGLTAARVERPAPLPLRIYKVVLARLGGE